VGRVVAEATEGVLEGSTDEEDLEGVAADVIV
jgi:hypothetical protein